MDKDPKNKIDCDTCASRLMGVFCALEGEPLFELSHHKVVNHYQKGQVIFYEGNQAIGLYCIFSGKVKLYKTGLDGKQQILRIAGPGSLLGYRALFAGEPYHGTAEALEEASICCIDRDAFFPVLAKNPELAMNIIKKLAKELRSAEDLATSIAHKTVRERMAELLLILKESYGKPAKKGFVIDLKLTREEMADMIGVTQETAIRLVSDFRKEGIIEVKDREITLLNIPSLIDIANIDL